MTAAFLLALGQMADRAFLAPMAKGVLMALALFAALVGLAGWGLGALAGGEGWLAGLAALAGGAAAMALATWFFVPALLATMALFLDPVAAAVERRHYPGLPPPAGGAGLRAQMAANLGLALRLGLLTLLALPLGLVAPPVGALAVWAISTLALGRELFDGVAQRRLSVAATRAARRGVRGRVYGAGGVLAAMALVPGLNLLVPVLGTAVMTHILHRRAAGAGLP